MGPFDFIFGWGRVLASSVSTTAKLVLVNIAGLGDGLTEAELQAQGQDTSKAAKVTEASTEETLFGAYGLVSRPRSPTALGTTEALCIRTPDGLQPIACRDIRHHKRYPAPGEGDVVLVHDGGGFVALADNADGAGKGTTLTVLAPKLAAVDGAVDKSHALVLDTSTATNAVALIHMDGMAVTMSKDGNLTIKNKDGSQFINLSDAEILINGVVKLLGGVVAGNAVLAQPVALYPAEAAFATALAAYLALVNAQLLLIPAPPTGPQTSALNAALAVVASAATVVTTPATGGSVTLKASPV